MDRLRAIFELRDMLRQMEHDIGLDDLSAAEKDVFQAAHRLTMEPGQLVQSDQIRSHPLVEGVAQADATDGADEADRGDRPGDLPQGAAVPFGPWLSATSRRGPGETLRGAHRSAARLKSRSQAGASIKYFLPIEPHSTSSVQNF